MEIINGKIITMAGAEYESGFIRTEGALINEIAPMNRYKRQQEDILDVEGAWVLPGLIEAHCHVGIVEEKRGNMGDDCNEGTEPATPQLRALDAINPLDPAFHDALSAGITGVMTGPGSANVVGGQFVFVKTHGRNVDEMKVLEPAAMKVAFGENPKCNYGDQNRLPSTRMAVAGLLREELFRAVRYCKWKENIQDQGSVWGDLDFKLEAWIPVLERKIPLKAHAHRTDDILTALRIAGEFGLDITLDHCTEGHLIAEEIALSGAPAIVGPSLTARSKIEVENMNFKTVGILNKKGICTAVTTDHPVMLIQTLPICAGMAVKHGLPMEEGLKSITIYPAKICRVDHRLGSLESGKDADIAIFDGNPMEIFTNTLYTLVNGKIVYEKSRDRL